MASFATICASHTPLLHDGEAPEETKAAVAAGFATLAQCVREFDPELIVQFSPDHFNGFFYDMMPAFCVGTQARSVGDWDTVAGPLPVASEEAAQLAEHLLTAGIDVAMSMRMVVDHGFVQIWEEMFGQADAFPAPIIPIFINCAAPPLPTYRRARLIGEAVGQWAKASGKRVLFAASGGLSHDPPTPSVVGASDEVRERLISGHNPSAQTMAARKSFVLAAGAAAAKREPPCQPLNPEWDRQIIQYFRDGNLEQFDELTTQDVRAAAGRGGNETLTWLAAFAAQNATGPSQARLAYYEAIDGWIAGMAMMSAVSADPPAADLA